MKFKSVSLLVYEDQMSSTHGCMPDLRTGADLQPSIPSPLGFLFLTSGGTKTAVQFGRAEGLQQQRAGSEVSLIRELFFFFFNKAVVCLAANICFEKGMNLFSLREVCTTTGFEEAARRGGSSSSCSSSARLTMRPE